MVGIIKRASVAHFHTLNWTLGAPAILIHAAGASGSVLTASLTFKDAAGAWTPISGSMGAGVATWSLIPVAGPALQEAGGLTLNPTTPKDFRFRLEGVASHAAQGQTHVPAYVTVSQGGVPKQGTVYLGAPPILIGVDIIELDTTPPNQWVDLHLRIL